MKREALKEMGLTDEQIDKVMAEHGNTVNDLKKKVEDAKKVEQQLDDYKKQIDDRDKQLKDLSKQAEGNEDLQAQIKKLQDENDTVKNKYEQKLQQQSFDHTLEKSLSGAKARNPKAVKALLDMDTIKMDGENLKGLDEQLNNLKENEPYLFESDEGDGGTPGYSTGEHQNTNTQTDAFVSALKGE
ncbi:phage scaffolding protein [Salipaludibacillus aurantiacus]|uniref:Phage minor structural protein GP20 n=1 Tax=Salipaludibacillus aurantiacus TaxID=1601833 RepID=A0A1H9U0U4_9BACI|nr:phage scaffolding protein [Salipaludibacillus aurantiacus]SES02774.1 Phage minor structural protein GP20 [Salipaludibacillus aurantiacus]